MHFGDLVYEISQPYRGAILGINARTGLGNHRGRAVARKEKRGQEGNEVTEGKERMK